MAQSNQNIDLRGTDLAAHLVRLRKERHWSKADLARNAGVSERTVHNLETESRERALEKTLLLLARALEVPIDELLGAPGPADDAPKARRPLFSRRHGLALLAVLCLVVLGSGWGVWRYARAKAVWEFVGDELIVRDAVFGTELWKVDGPDSAGPAILSPWRSDRILVGLGAQTASGGRLLCLDRASGREIWSVRPDIAAVERAFGTEVVRAANFGVNGISPIDVRGDGELEIVVQFTHGLYYPTAICLVDRDGNLLRQYANKGHVWGHVISDLDGDGKQEYLGAGNNNAQAYQGAQAFVLDDLHWRGASVDSLCNPESTEPDSALVRTVIPAFPEPYLSQLQASRITALEPRVHRSPTGEVLINIRAGLPDDCSMVVILDGGLHPLSCTPADAFMEKWVSQWPDSLTGGTGPGDPAWRAEWLARAVRFEAGHWPPPIEN